MIVSDKEHVSPGELTPAELREIIERFLHEVCLAYRVPREYLFLGDNKETKDEQSTEEEGESADETEGSDGAS